MFPGYNNIILSSNLHVNFIVLIVRYLSTTVKCKHIHVKTFSTNGRSMSVSHVVPAVYVIPCVYQDPPTVFGCFEVYAIHGSTLLGKMRYLDSCFSVLIAIRGKGNHLIKCQLKDYMMHTRGIPCCVNTCQGV